MNKFLTIIAALLLIGGFATADVYTESATDGTLDLPWAFNQWSHAVGDTIGVADSTGSAWGSHVVVFQDSGYTGLAHVADLVVQNYIIESDVYIVGEAVADFPLYSGIGVRMAHDEGQYYRVVFRNSTSSAHGQIRLQGYDGANWHISQYWNPGVDFDSLQTGWHNFKVKVIGAKFWVYLDGTELPGGPFEDPSPFLLEGYPGIYKYNSGYGEVVFDNFKVTTPDLYISEMIEGNVGSNKAWEVYNPMNTTANLDEYQIAQSVNGRGWQYWHTFPAGVTLAPGDVWTIIADQVDTTLYDTSLADEALSYPSVAHHNGDDARAIVKIIAGDTTWLDIFGEPDVDPGSGWDVAGVPTATRDHVLLRKRDVLMGNTDWAASAGTDADNSEWIVIAPNEHYNLADSLNTWNDFRYLGTQAVNEWMASVNMSIKIIKGEFDPANDHVSIAGNFNDWNPGLNAAEGTFSPADSVVSFADVIRNKEAGDTLFYKFVINGSSWEGVSNREYVLTGDPGTAPAAYWENINEYTPPVNLTFQVNMRVQILEGNFDPATEVVRTAGSHQGWSPSAANDMDDSDGDSIYVETVQVDPNTTYYYKHLIGTDWGNNENDPNREAVVGTSDLVLPVVWYKNDSVVTEIASGNIEFFVNMAVVEELGLFDQANDSLQLRGSFNGWGPSDAAKSLMNQNVLDPSEWFLNVPFVDAPKGETNYYKFFVQKDDTNHIWTDGYERPLTRGGGNREVLFNGDQSQAVDAVPYDDVSTEYVLTGGINLQVTFSVDMRPAIDPLKQAVPFNPAEDSLYWIPEQPLYVATQGWIDDKDSQMRVLLFDDADGDTVYTATLTVMEPGFNGFEYRYAFVDFSESTWTFEPSGFSAGAYRVRYAGQDAVRSFPVNPWPMPEDVWTNTEIKNVIELDPYDSYDKYLALDVQDIAAQIPDKFQLHQNYPNPFNPSTTFKFDLAQPGKATLKIFNVLGQEVVTVFDRNMKAGNHEYTWQATDANGYLLSSGVYFFQLVTENNIAVKKMVMLK